MFSVFKLYHQLNAGKIHFKIALAKEDYFSAFKFLVFDDGLLAVVEFELFCFYCFVVIRKVEIFKSDIELIILITGFKPLGLRFYVSKF